MSKRFDPVLNPDPTWIKSSRSFRIRIHNTDNINIFILYFSGMYACTTVPFKVSPSPLLSTSSNIFTVFCRQKIDGASQPCSFYRKLFYSNVLKCFQECFLMFSGMFSYVFRNVFLCFQECFLMSSFFLWCVFFFRYYRVQWFFYFQKKEESVGIWFF